MYEIYKNGHVFMQKKWHEEYGPVVGYFFGLFPVVLVADTELLKRVLLKDFHNFADRSVGLSMEIEPCRLTTKQKQEEHFGLNFMGLFSDQDIVNGAEMGDFDEALLVLKGQRWKEVRSTLTPSFTSKKLKQVSSTILTGLRR